MDESHCIKNDKSARTKAAEPIMKVNYLSVIIDTFIYATMQYRKLPQIIEL